MRTRLPIGKAGATFRLILNASITFGVAIQVAHTAGHSIDGWVIFGAALLAMKDVQSFINQAWGQAFHEQTEEPVYDTVRTLP